MPRAPRIVLVALLLAFVTACTPSDVVTTTTAVDEFTLHADGVGPVLFTEPAEDAIAALTPRLGGFSADTGDVRPPTLYGSCPGETMRAVQWGSFVALFADGRFVAWDYGFDPLETRSGIDPTGLGLRTETGFGLGSTRAEVERLHPELVRRDDPVQEVWAFAVDAEPVTIGGRFDGPGPDAEVIFLESLPGCD